MFKFSFKVETDSDSEKNQNTADVGSSSDNHSCFVARVTASNLRKDILVNDYFCIEIFLLKRRNLMLFFESNRIHSL